MLVLVIASIGAVAVAVAETTKRRARLVPVRVRSQRPTRIVRSR